MALNNQQTTSTRDSPTRDPAEDVDYPASWTILRQLAHVNSKYFSTHDDENGLRIHLAHLVILDISRDLYPTYKYIENIAPEFDFNENTPGNGYRSFLSLVDKCILHNTEVCQQICSFKNSVLFRKSHYMREIEACSHLIASLSTFLNHLKTLYGWSETADDGKLSLFPSDEHSSQELLNKTENDIDQYCFYGRCLAFQFADSIKYFLKTILVAMASFSEVYYKNGSLFGRCTNSIKYMIDPEARARRIVNISQRATVDFCKTFWLLNETELVQFVPFMLLVPSLSINQVISIPPEELSIPAIDGLNIVTIPIPTSHLGKKPIHVRLLSSKRRIGMVGSAAATTARYAGELYGPSDTLLFHCHGGGFVAQSSKCHEIYLRHWAIQLDVPLLSVDYSLAPEAPYPRAVEEVVYTYAWVLKHAHSLLGSSIKKIILIGDSAGANLNLALMTKCFELNIRKPDGIFMAYVPVLVEFTPSPARLLGLTDPMLPFGFMMRCLKAYTIGDDNACSNHSRRSSRSDADSTDSTQNILPIIKDDLESKEMSSNKSDTASEFAEISESDLIALALSPNGNNDNNDSGEMNNDKKTLASLPSDSTLNSVSCLIDADTAHAQEIQQHQEYLQQDTSCTNNALQSTSTSYIEKLLNLYKNFTFGKSANYSKNYSNSDSNAINDNNNDSDKNKIKYNSDIANDYDNSDGNTSASFFGLAFGTARDKLSLRQLDTNNAKSPTEEFVFTVPRDPLLSPYRISNDILKQLPPTKILTTNLDPCLDDCVMFARKLKTLGTNVSLDILSGLPHGFLSFSVMSKDAHEGSELCIKRIKELIDI